MKTVGTISLQTPLGRRLNSAVAMAVLFFTFGTHSVFADDEALMQRISKLERALDNQGLLDMFQRLEALQSEVQTLRGQIEGQQYTIDRLRQSQRDAYVDLDRRLQESLQFRGATDPNALDSNANPPLTVYQPGVQPEVAGTPAPGIDVSVQQSPALNVPPVPNVLPGSGPSDSVGQTPPGLGEPADLPVQTGPASVDTLPTPAPAQAAGGVQQSLPVDPNAPESALAAVQQPPTQSADQAYREAFGLLKAGKYDESIEAFNLFLLDYPNSEYADNSQYWLGETYFVKQDYTAAIDQYQKLITNYPASKKQSHALLKIGYSFQRLGELDRARAVLEDLQTRYPGSTAARLAAERVQQIATGTQ